jgi:hypothetical protein
MLLFIPIYHINFTPADMACFKWLPTSTIKNTPHKLI